MKTLFLALGLSMFVIGASIPPGAGAGDPTRPIADLQANGWKVIEKKEEKKELPGLPPYENLTRVVQIVHYKLEKGAALMICQATYDSQRDRYDESCRQGSR